MDFRFSRFSEDEPPHRSKLGNRANPNLKKNLFEVSESEELVQVYLRVKPTNTPNSLYSIIDNRSFVTNVDTTSAGHGRRTQNNVSKLYTFSHIFGADVSQKEIFDHVVKNNLRELTAEGRSYTLLTYGASGSGKTYTLMGTEASPGLVPRSLEYLFKLVDAAQYPVYKPLDGHADRLSYEQQNHELQWVSKLRNVSAPHRDKYKRMSVRLTTDFAQSTFDLTETTKYYVWVSFVEIYNEAIYDLLVPGDRKTAPKLIIREDTNGNVHVKGARHAFVRSGAEAYDVMVAGKQNLQVAATGVHAHSSRSHCIFTITLLTDTPNGIKISSVKLCDLAGSERMNRTHNTGARMTESRSINTSLHVLERCLHALRRNQPNIMVPYRESKLTRLLGSGLSGARGEPVTMLVTVNTSPHYINETRHVLQLATVAKEIQINNTIFEQNSTSSSVEDMSSSLNSEILKLRVDNERLEFEFMQLVETNKKLLASIEEERALTAKNTKEIVQEVKDMSRQYYEAQLESMKEHYKAEMDEVLKELQAAKNNTINKEHLLKIVSALETTDDKLEERKLIKQLRLHLEDGDYEIQIIEQEPTDFVQNHKQSDEHDYRRETYNTSDVSVRESSYLENDRSFNESKRITVHSIKDDHRKSSNSTYDDKELYDSVINESTNKSTNSSIDDSIMFNGTSSANSIDDQSKRGTYFIRHSIPKKVSPNCIQLAEEVIEEIETDNKDVSFEDTRQSYVSEKSRNSTNYSLNVDPDTESERIDEGVYCIESPKGVPTVISDTKSQATDKQDLIKTTDIVKDNVTNVISIDLIMDSDSKSALESKEIKTNTSNLVKDSIVRGSSVNGSLTLFENYEEAIKKEIEAQHETVKEGSILHHKEKTSYFGNLTKEVISEENEHDEDFKDEKHTPKPEDFNSVASISPCKSVPKYKLPKLMSLDIFESPQLEKKEHISIIDECVEKIDRSLMDLSLVHNHKLNTNKEFFNYNQNKTEDNVLFRKETGKECENISHVVAKKVKSFDSKSTNIEGNQILDNYIKLPQNYIEPIKDNASPDKNNDRENTDHESHIKVEPFAVPGAVVDEEQDQSLLNAVNITKASENDTLNEFEKLYKQLDASTACEDIKDSEFVFKTDDTINNKNTKYNFRNKKTTETSANVDVEMKNEDKNDENKIRTKRALRLRKCKNVDENEEFILKNIENLKEEYCDVISNKPELLKVAREPSPSPEKVAGDEENKPPNELQSCPAKSTARSRRKLFTPRAEPLEQSPGDSGGRLRVPRPSYTRSRVRRRL